MNMLIRIPLKFYRDHFERELPTPVPLKQTARYVWIDTNDPAFDELVDDAEHYAHRWGPDGCPDMVAAAKSLLRIINKRTPLFSISQSENSRDR
jgi:hypothetical protein